MIILPSLEIVPAKYNTSTNTLLSQIPIDGTGDFTVSRTTSPVTNQSTRVNALGLIETVPDNVPRLDYPIGGGCPALLVEPSAQNLVQRSEEFNNAFWSPIGLNAFGSGSVANTTATRDPYGTNLADYIQENSTPSSAHLILAIFSGNVSGTTYTWSVFAKAAERTIINLLNNAAGGGNANFNLTTGVVTLNTGVSASMENYGNGWWRCRLTYTSAITGNHNIQIRLCDASGNATYNGTGNQGAYIFGAQLETGSVATSYIPTTVSGVTRAADVITDTTASGVIGQTEGTIYVEGVITNYADAAASFITISDNTINNRLEIRKSSLGSIIFERASATQSASTSINATGQGNGVFKMAVAYKSGDTAFFINGVQVATTNAATFTMNTLTHIYLGSNASGTARWLNDRIRAAALYPTRLTDTQLALLTSPYTSYSSMASALSYTLG